MDPVAVIDFETTGLSPDYGDRANEMAAVLLRDDRIVDQVQSLRNGGQRIPCFIEHLAGISNAMVREAPRPAKSWPRPQTSSATIPTGLTMPRSIARSGMPSWHPSGASRPARVDSADREKSARRLHRALRRSSRIVKGSNGATSPRKSSRSGTAS